MIFNLKKFEFGTKAGTLESLKSLIKESIIPEFIFFSTEEWITNSDAILTTACERFQKNLVIVRSSSSSEDNSTLSMAGSFTSIPDIDPSDKKSLSISIHNVINSYQSNPSGSVGKDYVLIQEMVKNVSMSGVLFTQDMKTGAPYYVINYDDQTGRTDTVTSGSADGNRTLLLHRESLSDVKSSRFRSLIKSVKEVELVTGRDSLDIEFAVSPEDDVFLFQVREITTQPNWNRGISLKVNDAIERIQAFVSERIKPVPGIYGRQSIFGQMPDWNPAEIIGCMPRPLAFSLYRRLITDSTWRIARSQMGYFEPVGAFLMVSFFGQPFIDVRLSFNSFLPNDLNPEIADKLVNAWISHLSFQKELHDKIEFDVAITAYDFSFDKKCNERLKGVLSSSEKSFFKASILKLTRDLISGKVASIESELKKVDQLEIFRSKLVHDVSCPLLSTVSALLDDCIQFGTIPFSILARHGFVAQSLLRSLVERDVCDSIQAQTFLSSINTVAGDMVRDIHFFSGRENGRKEFIRKYGHLRPGTYDILSLRYDQRQTLIDRLLNKEKVPENTEKFSFSSGQMKDINGLIEESKLDVNAEILIDYIRRATTAREYSKFVFTKNISDSLEIIATWGEKIGLSREDLSYLSISDIIDGEVVAKGRSLEQHLRDKSQMGFEDHQTTLSIRLPFIIESPEDVSVVPLLINRPNFITNNIIRGDYVYLTGRDERSFSLDGKIVLIESADPGFDWIFAYALRGLVTKYGGLNSHMAIRCAEFGLPAAIGCGEQIFDLILRNSGIEMNCAEGRIVPTEI